MKTVSSKKIPASQLFFCYSFLNMGPVNLTADEPEVVIWSQCHNQNIQSDKVILERMETLFLQF